MRKVHSEPFSRGGGLQPTSEQDAYYAGGSADAKRLSGSRQGSFGSMRERKALTPDSPKLVLAMVGLPGRGKSFISRKVGTFVFGTFGCTCAYVHKLSARLGSGIGFHELVRHRDPDL